MEVKDIIKEDRNKIVPSYEYKDYYREDGSYLYNSNREANWYKIGVHDCFDYFEQNRLKACDNQTPEQAWRESEFVVSFVKEHHRTPTFSDAIEGTRKQMIDKACKLNPQKDLSNPIDHWQDLRERAAIAVLQAMVTDKDFQRYSEQYKSEMAIAHADALVEKLKGE